MYCACYTCVVTSSARCEHSGPGLQIYPGVLDFPEMSDTLAEDGRRKGVWRKALALSKGRLRRLPARLHVLLPLHQRPVLARIQAHFGAGRLDHVVGLQEIPGLPADHQDRAHHD